MAGPSLIPRLERPAWIVLAGDAVSALGTGLTLPFLYVYLHDVRGFAPETAALALSMLAVASFAGNLTGGWLVDRVGARRALIAGLVLAAAGTASIALVREPVHAFMATALLGLGASIEWPAFDSLLARVITPEQRSAAFSLRHATMNAGLGSGALIAAAVVSVSDPASFEAVYLLDALSFLLFIPFLFLVPANLAGVHREHAGAAEGGYRELLRDRVFLWVWGVTALLFLAGYSQQAAAFPAYATGEGGIEAGDLAIAFTANTFVVVVLQLVVLRAVTGRRRTSTLLAACGCWAAAWAVTLVAGGAGSVALFAAAMVIFALGETLVSPALAPIVNDIAPERLRGRYNGGYTLALTTGFAVGPAIAGLGIGAGQETLLFLGLIAACGICAAMVMRLARLLPESANRIAAGDLPDEELALPAELPA